MKNIFLVAAIAAAGLSLASCKGGNREKDKADFVKTCMDQGGNQMAGVMKDYFEDYCECSADKVLDKYSAKEIKDMEADARTQGQAGQEAMMAKLMPVVKPCLDELQKKAMDAQSTTTPPAQ